MTLTANQRQALHRGEPILLTVDGIDCVLLSREAFEESTELDSSPWTAAEINRLTDEAEEIISDHENQTR